MGKINDFDRLASFDVGKAVEASGFTPGEFAEIASTFIGDLPRISRKVAAAGDPTGDPAHVVLHEVVNSLRSVGAARMAAKVARLETAGRRRPARIDAEDLQEVVGMLCAAAGSLQAWLDANPPRGQDAGPR